MRAELLPIVVSGYVADLTDLGRVVLVHLDLAPETTALVVIDYPNGTRAARAWTWGDRITAWGRTPATTDLAESIAMRAHTVQRWRTGHTPNPADPIRRTPPRQRPIPARFRQDPSR